MVVTISNQHLHRRRNRNRSCPLLLHHATRRGRARVLARPRPLQIIPYQRIQSVVSGSMSIKTSSRLCKSCALRKFLTADKSPDLISKTKR